MLIVSGKGDPDPGITQSIKTYATRQNHKFRRGSSLKFEAEVSKFKKIKASY